MNTKKPLVVAGLIAAISVGSVGVAQASTGSSHKTIAASHKVVSVANVNQVDPITSVLAKLVTAGTITQAQSDAIVAALKADRAAHAPAGAPSTSGGTGTGGQPGGQPGGFRGGHGPFGVNIKADETVITTTLGITSTQLESDLAAGQSLATIAGSKTSALISALVAAETSTINSQVTAGKLTQAQATKLISGLTTVVTDVVNATPGKGFGGGFGGFGGHGQGNAPMIPAPSTTPSN